MVRLLSLIIVLLVPNLFAIGMDGRTEGPHAIAAGRAPGSLPAPDAFVGPPAPFSDSTAAPARSTVR